MKNTLILISIIASLLSCSRARGDVPIEVSGKVFTDSTHSEIVAGAEVVLLSASSVLFSRNYYEEVESTQTDSMGNYFLTTVTEEDQRYYVWPKPDLFKYTSGSNTPIVNEWKRNSIDLEYVSPIILNIELIGDSICDQVPGQIEGMLSMDIFQSLDYFSFGYSIEESIPLSWTQDTVISLLLGPATSLSIQFIPQVSSSGGNCYHGVTWKEEYVYEQIDSTMTIRLKRW